MHGKPPRVLRQLVELYGETLVLDPRRTEALLADLCGEYSREIFLLVHAQKLHIPQEIESVGRPEPSHVERWVRQLELRYGFAEVNARWAVESWLTALQRRTAHRRFRLVPFLVSAGLGLVSQAAALRRRLLRPGNGGVSAETERRSKERSATRRRTPALRPVLLAVISVLLLATLVFSWTSLGKSAVAESLIFWRNEGRSAADGWDEPSAERAAQRMAARYPPPRQSRIDSDLLQVRSNPSLDSEVVGYVGPQGAQISVEQDAPDGRWSFVSTPVAGWISNDYLSTAWNGEWVSLRPGIGQVTLAGLAVHASPTASSQTVGTLVADRWVEYIAASEDGDWLELTWPVAGWVEAIHIAVPAPTYTN